MSRGASPGGSPGGSPRSDNKGPSALRNELAAAKKAVEVLKMEKDATQEKLEKLHGVLETERGALREVLQAARKAVDDLKVEKQEVEDNLTKEQETTKWQAEEIERLKRLQGGDSSQTTILNQQITSLNTTITQLRQTITQHEMTINQLRQENTQLRQENSSLQQQLEDARRSGGNQQASDAENSKLRQTISDLQSQLDQFRSQQSQSSAGDAQLAEQLRIASDAKVHLEIVLERMKSEHQAELDRMAARIPPPGAGGASDAENSKLRQTISDLQSQLDQFRSQQSQSSAGDAQLAQLAEQLRIAIDAKVHLEIVLERMKKEHQAELDRMAARVPPPGAGGGDANTRQLEAVHKKNLMKLVNVQRECGIRWMNQILFRHSLHARVATFVWWKCYANAQLGSSVVPDIDALRAKHAQQFQMLTNAKDEELQMLIADIDALRAKHAQELQMLTDAKDEELQMLTDAKDEELKAQLAQAGRGLKRWMEDRELEGEADHRRRKTQAIKMLCKVLAQWAAGTVAGCVIQWKLNFAESSTDNLTDRYNAAMVAKLRMLRRQSAVLAMKEIITRWMNTEQNLGFMRWHGNLKNDKALRKLFLLESKAKDAGMASYWKDEAERVAALFDKRKAAFEATQKDHEYHRKDLQDRHDAKLAELEKVKAELNIAVGDLAHQMNESETARQNYERLSEVNARLENVVRDHVVEGAVMRGKLGKQGSVIGGNVNQRWCVLDARQLSLFEDQSEHLAKTVIPLKDIAHIRADPEFKRHGFQIHLKDNKEAREHQKTETFRFEANSSDDMQAWMDNLNKLQGNQGALNESWDSIRANYVDQIKIEQDRLFLVQQNFTTYKTDCTQKADEQLQKLEEKYEALLKGQAKIDDDLWMWVERHMWQQTSAQGLGFGEQKMAQALGGTGGIPCHIATNWTDFEGKNAGTEIDEHCTGANDGQKTTFTVNFECPSNMEEVMAVVKIQKQQVVAAPPVPIKDPKEEVKKLQRLMVLRNPSPPRSKSRGAGDHSASPRGKSPPKKRGTGSISSSPRR